MECREVREVVFLYTDNEMGGELLISFRRHLELCPGCAARISRAETLVRILRQRCARAAAPERLRHRILTSFAHRQDGRR